MWNYVIPHFTSFLQELQPSTDDYKDAFGKAERIAKSLFSKYYPNLIFDPQSYMVVGSVGKGTAAKPRTDVDMLFILPVEEFGRINTLQNNKQSQLLREVKEKLIWTFPKTDIVQDGQIVLVPFDTYSVEVVPAFRYDNTGLFVTPHTGDGGSWRLSNPTAEYNYVNVTDRTTNWKATHLTTMLKAWNRECHVGFKSVSLEVAATEFIKQWHNRDKTIYWYDWMVRDFFAFMYPYVNGRSRIIGTEEWIDLGDSWRTKLQTAYANALKACDYEKADDGLSACWEWQKIFGNQFRATMHYIPMLAAAP